MGVMEQRKEEGLGDEEGRRGRRGRRTGVVVVCVWGGGDKR